MQKNKVLRLAQFSMLIAIIAVMAFTPLGFLKLGIVEITFITIPVVIGAVMLGPAAGALLGGAFGIMSFIQCFGMSAFGAALLEINPILTMILCIVPRVLMGWLSGVIYRLIANKNETAVKMVVACLAGALLNTLFFVGGLLLLFGKTEFIMGMRGGQNIIAFFVAFVGLNGAIEAVATGVLGGAICKALKSVRFKKRF